MNYDAKDEWLLKVADKPACCYDLYATMLHLLGIAGVFSELILEIMT